MMKLQKAYLEIEKSIHSIQAKELLLSAEEEQNLHSEKVKQILRSSTSHFNSNDNQRIHDEIYEWGPLNSIISDESITEIIINNRESIWIEKSGQLQKHNDMFFSSHSFQNFLDRLSHASQAFISKERPCADGQFGPFRVSFTGADITRSEASVNIRRHPKNPWSFEKLFEQGWCNSRQLDLMRQMSLKRENFLIVGGTGAGKTSVLNSFLNTLAPEERSVIIEDTPEIEIPHGASLRLVTREDPQGVLPNIDQCQLVKRSLRLRPDRIIMGEIRGAEAKDFLMALATGHKGSFGTLHARDATQALLRLEMLIQMGAPQWSIESVRRLMHLTLKYIIVTKKNEKGARCLDGIYRISSLETQGFLIEPMD